MSVEQVATLLHLRGRIAKSDVRTYVLVSRARRSRRAEGRAARGKGSLVPRPSRKAERGSGVLSDIS